MTETAPPGPTAAQWVAGARPRTLPAAITPVLAGTGVAFFAGGFSWPLALLALVVSLALQVGVNYANDYSDGIRGTDADRVGPMRLVGSGVARPGTVKSAAFACFGIAAVAGLILVIATAQWWLLLVGVACIVAAWFYTGGKHPYGYLGLGEVFVFVFFGVVAVCGTTLVQLGRIPLAALLTSIGVGAITCAVLVANNLRDIHGDAESGKRTLATRIGAPATRGLYTGLIAVTAVMIIIVAALTTWWALLGLIVIPVIVPAVRTVLAKAEGPALIAVLKSTGVSELVMAVGLTAGLVVGRLLG